MTKKVARDLGVISGELQTALKGEATNIIVAGGLLVEAQEQLEHGQWLPWLKANFGSSVSTAENYMNAARLAAEFPTVANLKLRPSALYVLGRCWSHHYGPFSRAKVIEAVLAAAENEWVDSDRAREIARSLSPPKDEGKAAEAAAAAAEAVAEAAAAAKAAAAENEAEAESILDGPPPELPPTPDAAHDVILPPFDQALKTLGSLITKPLDRFVATSHAPSSIRATGDFLIDVADAIDRQHNEKHDAA